MSALEPLAVLGLAGNIFQFVEAAAKLCTMVIQIRRKTLNDILKEHFQPAEIARKMGCCVQALRANKYPTCYNKDETRLNEIADECISISEELNAVVQLIEDRYVAVSEESSKIVQIAKGFRLGAQLLQTRSRVRDLAKRLDDHRNLLTDTVVACLPEKIDKMHKDLGETAGGARGFYKGILDAINSNDQRLDEKMQELRESVNKLVNKHFLEDITVARSPDTLLQDSALQLGDASFASGKPTDLLYTLIAIARDASPLSVEDGILDSLSFKLIEDRKTSVKPAYQNTFEWILDSQPSGSPEHPENEFPRWLLDGSGIFWLPGKAGCGKSTLMKFLLAHHQLKSSLLQWAGEDELLITSYFFWAAGSSLQKNQEGLLRSLLFSILSQRKDLLPKLFPYRYNAVMNKSKILFSCCEPNCAAVFDKAQEMSWHLDKKHSIKSEKEQERITSLCEKEFTISELYHVFLNLAQNFTKGLKIALVVDGLDEYQGDQSDLVDLFKKLTAGSNIKAIVSSRPEPLFTDALRTYPSLRMDLLTRRDMELYVKSKLGNQLRMQHLLAKDAGILEELSKSVANQSSGVFLWTALVVKLLREMLEDGCFLHELQQAVYAYPVEISDLYRHMLLRMREGHKSEGFRIFRLAQLAKQIEGCFPSLLRFWFFVSELPGGSVQTSSELPDRATFQEQLEITTKRIQSRCCGLLECVTHAATGEDYDEGLVKPFHRTVSDFLREPDVIDMIEKQTGDFQPHSRLLETILWCLKRKWVWRTTSREHWEALKKQLELVMVYLGLSEDRKTSRTDYLNTLDEAMVQFWGRKREAKSRKAFADYQKPWFQLLDKTSARSMDDLRPQHHMTWLALCHGISGVVKNAIDADRVQWDAGWGYIFAYIICSAVYTDVDAPIDPETTTIILELIKKSMGFSRRNAKGTILWERPVWEIVLFMRPLGSTLAILPQHFQQMIMSSASKTCAFERWAQVVLIMIATGATLSHSFLPADRGRRGGSMETISADQIIEDGITAYFKAREANMYGFTAQLPLPNTTVPDSQLEGRCQVVYQLQRLVKDTSAAKYYALDGSGSCSDLSLQSRRQKRKEKKVKKRESATTSTPTSCEETLSRDRQPCLNTEPKIITMTESEQNRRQSPGSDPSIRSSCSTCDAVRVLATEMNFGAREILDAVDNAGSGTNIGALANWILERQGVVDDGGRPPQVQSASTLPARRSKAGPASPWSKVVSSRADSGKQQSDIPGAVWVESTDKRHRGKGKREKAGDKDSPCMEGMVISKSRRLKWTVAEGPGLTADEQAFLNDVFGG